MLDIKARAKNALQFERHKGFSLIEMAVVMLIVGLLLSGLFVALGDSAANRNRISAAAELENLKEALYGFAQTTGRLPCPAVVGSTGVESPQGGGACTRAHGFIPAATLGLQGSVDGNGLLLDPWGNPYRYSLSDRAMTIDDAFSIKANLRSLFSQGALTTTNSNLFCVAGAAACAAPIYAITVPALIYSMGADWGNYTSALQLENASTPLVSGFRMATDNNFINSVYVDEGTNAFDDILVWLSPNVLYSRLIAAGQLP